MNSNARNLVVTFLHEETVGKIMSPVGRDKLPIHRESSWKLACSCRRPSNSTFTWINPYKHRKTYITSMTALFRHDCPKWNSLSLYTRHTVVPE